jgi:antitoxin component of MazEF toxin-antitoxin module
MGFPLVPVRVKRWGSSLAFVIPKGLRDDLHIGEGDIIAIRVHQPYATFCVWPMNKLAPLGEVPVDTLPPKDPTRLRRDK